MIVIPLALLGLLSIALFVSSKQNGVNGNGAPVPGTDPGVVPFDEPIVTMDEKEQSGAMVDDPISLQPRQEQNADQLEQSLIVKQPQSNQASLPALFVQGETEGFEKPSHADLDTNKQVEPTLGLDATAFGVVPLPAPGDDTPQRAQTELATSWDPLTLGTQGSYGNPGPLIQNTPSALKN
jgi:hypothetical protein